MNRYRVLALLVLPVLGACQLDRVTAPTAAGQGASRPALIVVNDEQFLSSRVQEQGGSAVSVVPTAADGMAALVGDDTELPFRLLRTIALPEVNGVKLPATHVVFYKDFAFVSYAPAGETLVGAIDVFDVKRESSPRLISSARFGDAKVTTLAVERGYLYVGTASADPAFAETPAVVERIPLDSRGRLLGMSRRIAVASHVVTGIAVAEDRVWVGSGHSAEMPGGLTVIDEDDFKFESFEPLPDVRAVAASDEGIVAVLLGSGARMRLYDAERVRLMDEFAIGGLTQLGHKATIATEGDWAFVAAGDSGAVFTRLSVDGRASGAKRISWGSPAGVAGVAEADAVTNAVAVSGSYAYAANGGAGVWVARGNWKDRDGDESPTITPKGRLDLPGVSVNMVGVKKNALFVAAGMGGMLILEQPEP
jgi:hypothetical protein